MQKKLGIKLTPQRPLSVDKNSVLFSFIYVDFQCDPRIFFFIWLMIRELDCLETAVLYALAGGSFNMHVGFITE